MTPVSASVRFLTNSFCWAILLARFGGAFGNFVGIFFAPACCGLDFGGAGGWASASFGFFCGFSGMISAVGSGARGFGLDGVSDADGAGFGGGGGGAGCLRLAACCSSFAVLTSPPSFTLVFGTVCTISSVTSGWSSGSGRFKDGNPTIASRTMPRCSPIEMYNERGFIDLYH